MAAESEPVIELTDEERDTLIVQAVAGSGPLTRDQAEAVAVRVCNWAIGVYFDAALLRLVLAKRLVVVYDPDNLDAEPKFWPAAEPLPDSGNR